MNIKELRRLERAATPGPWETTTWDGLLYVASVQQLQGSYVCELGIGSDGAERDAALIAAARNALPALLRVAEAARELAAGPESTAWDELYAAIAALEATR